MRITLLFPFLLALLQPVSSQVSFKRLYGTPGNDEAYFVEVLGDGSFIVAGQTTPGALGGQDALLTKFSANGTVQWSRVFGGAGTDAFRYLLACSDGNFIAAGETTSLGAGNVDIYLVKFDPNGNAIWERTAGGANQETVSGITEVSDGYVVSGGTQSFGAGFWDIFVQKIGLNGNHQWSKAWGGGGGDIAGEPFPAPNNEIWVTGFTFIGTGNHDPFLFRLAANGNLLNGTRQALPVNNGLGSLGPAGSGLLSGGGTWVGNNHQPLVFRFNATGGIVWAKRYPITGGDFGCHAEPTADGGAIFSANELDSDTPDAVLVKLDGDGDVVWAKAHSFEGIGRLFHVRQAPDGGYVAVGYALGSGRDFFILKTNSLGEVQECCPDDISVASVSLSPSLVNITPAEANGPASASNSGNNQTASLSSLDICNGPICCIYPTAVIAPPPPITCNDPLITLDGTGSSAGSGFTYQWTGPGIVSGATTLAPVVNQGGLYTLVVTETATGCFTPASVVVADLSQPPLAVAVAPATVTCASPEVVVSGTGSSTGPDIAYQWTGPGIVSGANSLNPVVDLGGTYTLTVVNTATGCESQVSVTVNQNTTLPTVEAGPGQQLDCDSPVVLLNGSGSSAGPGFSYQWTGPGVAGGGNTLQASVNQPGTYTLTITNTQSGCQASDQVLVNADFTFPVIQLTDPAAINCAQPQVELDATGSSQGPDFSIQWTTTGGEILQGANTLTPLVGAAGLYTLTILNTGNGCSNAEGLSVTGNPEGPEADAGPGGELTCSQTAIELQGIASGPGSPYALEWTANPGQIASGAGSLNPVVISAGLYIFTVTDTLLGCTASDSVAITQDGNLPQIQLSLSNDLTCLLTTATLDGTGSSLGSPYIFAWSTPDGQFAGGTETLIAVVGQAGQYTLSITDTLNDCTVSQTVLVEADTLAPVPVIAPPSLLTCAQPEIGLEVSVGGSGDFSFEWTTPDGQPLTDLSPLIDQPGLFELAVTDTLNGCSSSAEVLVESDFAAPLVDAGPGGVLTCADTVLALSGTADGGGALLTVLWATADGNILSGSNTFDPVVDAPGTYLFFAVNEDNGCVDSSQVVVAANQVEPLADAGEPGLLNCYQPNLLLDGSGSSAGPSVVYAWTTNDGQILEGASTLAPLAGQAGLYQLMVTDTVSQCLSVDSVWVSEDFEIPQADAGPLATLTCALPEAQLNGSGSQGPVFSYTWTSPNGLILSGGQTLTPVVAAAGLYELQVTNQENGCSSSAEVLVESDFAAPLVDAGPGGVLTCADTVLALSGTADGGGALLTVLWATVDGNILSGSNTFDPVVDAPGTYLFFAVNEANGCADSSQVVVTANQVEPLADAGEPGLLNCYQPNLLLDGSGSSAGPSVVYAWTTNDGQILEGASTLAPLAGQAGLYQLMVTDTVSQCLSVDSVWVSEDFEIPQADAGPPATLTCASPEAQLNGSGSQGPVFSYTWTSPNGLILSGGQTLTPVVAAAGLYELQVTNQENGCSAADPVQVQSSVDLPFAVVETPPLLTCQTTQVILNGEGSETGPEISYVWTTIDGLLLSGANTLQPLAGQSGVYQLTVTNTANGCSNAATVAVFTDTLSPQVQAGPDAWLTCAVQTLSMNEAEASAGPQYAYTWTTPDGSILSGSQGLNPEIGAPGTYVLQVTDQNNGCQAADTLSVLQDTLPPLALVAEPAVLTCATPLVVLDASASSQGAEYLFTWTTPDGNIVSGADTPHPEVDVPGGYELLITNLLNGCASGITLSVFQDTLSPLVDAGAGGTLTCSQTQLTLNGIAGSQDLLLSWTTQDGNILSGSQGLTPQIDQPGVYTLTAIDLANGCTASDEVVVDQDTLAPLVVIASPGQLTCAQEQLVLSAAAPVAGYFWTSPNGSILGSDTSLSIQIGAPGLYVLTATDPVNGCTGSDSVEVSQNIALPDAEAGPDLTLSCVEDQAELSGSGSALSGQVQVVWTTTDGQLFSGAEQFQALIGSGGWYWLTVTDLVNGCSASDSVFIAENAPYQAGAEAAQPPCTGDVGRIVVGSVAGGTPPYLFSIDGGESFQVSPVFEGLSPGLYPVIVQDALGCETAAEAVLLVDPIPVEILLEATVEMKQGDVHPLLTEVNVPVSRVAWSPAAGLSCTDCLNPEASPLQTTQYFVEVADANGCQAAASVWIYVDQRGQVFVPNIFSPNGDGENDVFYLFADPANIREVRSFLVFDRWGEMVFEYYRFLPNNPAHGWDGTFRGAPQNPAVYAWFAEIEFIDGRVELLEGPVTLIR